MPMLTIIEAAAELRVSRRWLEYWLAANPVDTDGIPFYVPTGRSKKFAPTDIERMLAHMRDLEAARLGPGVRRMVTPSGWDGVSPKMMAVILGLTGPPKVKQPRRPRGRLPRAKKPDQPGG
jgi:hypothetical protein